MWRNVGKICEIDRSFLLDEPLLDQIDGALRLGLHLDENAVQHLQIGRDGLELQISIEFPLLPEGFTRHEDLGLVRLEGGDDVGECSLGTLGDWALVSPLLFYWLFCGERRSW